MSVGEREFFEVVKQLTIQIVSLSIALVEKEIITEEELYQYENMATSAVDQEWSEQDEEDGGEPFFGLG